MPALDALRNFDLENASTVLWTFKGPRGPAGSDPSYTGHWVDTTDDVDALLKDIITNERARIEEVLEYGLLAQNHEASALSITTIETHAGLIVDEATVETPGKKTTKVKQIQNSDFYVIKSIYNHQIIFAVKKLIPDGGQNNHATCGLSILLTTSSMSITGLILTSSGL
jgi:hypothetical protein